MLIWFIIACEIGFWVVLGLGLFVRYVLKLTKLSRLVLLCVPLLDIALLVATTIDLSRGRVAEFAHGLAAVYLGFTIVFGHSIIHWADNYVSKMFYGGESLNKNIYGWAYAKYEWIQWLKGALSCAIAVILLLLAVWYIGDSAKSAALIDWFSHLFWLLAIWLVGWPVWYSVFLKREARP